MRGCRSRWSAARARWLAARAEAPGPQQRLAEQLPEVGFPTGITAPSTVVFGCVLLLAAVTAGVLRGSEPSVVPGELLASQQRLADSVARSVAAAARQSLADLRTAAELATGGPAQLVEAIRRSHPRWKGTALLDGATRTVVAGSGAEVPVGSLPAALTDTVRPLTRPGVGIRFLVAVRLSGIGQDGKLVAAVTDAQTFTVPIPGFDTVIRQGLLLVAAGGQVIESQGSPPAARDLMTRTLLDRAGRAAGSGDPGIVVGPPPSTDPGSRSGRSGRTAVVAYAPVAGQGLSGARGLAVLSVVNVPATGGPATGHWALPTGTLLLVGLLGFLVVRLAVISPVHRLRRRLLSVASGQLRPRADRFLVAEVQRIAESTEYCRSTVAGGRRIVIRPRFTLPADAVVAVAVLGLLSWSVAVAATLGRDNVGVPPSLAASARSVLATTNQAVGRTLQDGVAALRVIANLTQGLQVSAVQPTLERFTARQDRYRSVYILDAAGNAIAVAGRTPLRDRARPPAKAGITQHNTEGRVPVLTGHVPLPGNRQVLIGEFDLDHLTGLLQSASGRLRVVDAELRTLVANRGFVAFDRLTDPGLREGVADARTGQLVSTVTDVGGDRSLLAAATVVAPIGSAPLRWTVIGDQPVSSLALTGNDLRRRALVVALAGVLLAVVLGGWHHLLVSRPLRRVATAADRLAAGDTGTVLFPQRQDEIGTVACCLEICRQALTEGAGRLGAVRRQPHARGAPGSPAVRSGRH